VAFGSPAQKLPLAGAPGLVLPLLVAMVALALLGCLTMLLSSVCCCSRDCAWLGRFKLYEISYALYDLLQAAPWFDIKVRFAYNIKYNIKWIR
jgi:hypothetical protein